MDSPKRSSKYIINGEPIEFNWPEYIAPFPMGRASVCTEELLKDCEQYLLSLVKSENISTKILGKPDFFASFVFSNCADKSKLSLLTNYYNLTFYQDDNHDVSSGDIGRSAIKSRKFYSLFIEILESIVVGKVMDFSHLKPFHRAIFECLVEICKTYSSIQKKRLIEYVKDIYIEIIAECELYDGLKSQEELKPLIFEIGVKNRGTGIAFQLIEYALGIEVSEEEWNDQNFQKFLDRCSKTIMYRNDIVSFRKEILECNGNLRKCTNMIAYLVTVEKLSLQEAIDKLMNSINECDKEIMKLTEELSKLYSNSKDFLIFIEETKKFIGSSWLYHYGCKRYHGDLIGFPPLTGRFIFSESKTIIIPSNSYNHNKYKHLKDFYKF